jgi:hypothetical protein
MSFDSLAKILGINMQELYCFFVKLNFIYHIFYCLSISLVQRDILTLTAKAQLVACLLTVWAIVFICYNVFNVQLRLPTLYCSMCFKWTVATLKV